MNKNNFKFPKKKPKKADKLIRSLNEQERFELLGTLLQVSNAETIKKMALPAIEEGYNSAYILLYEDFIDSLNEDNKEEKINALLGFIVKKYGLAKQRRMEIEANIQKAKEQANEVQTVDEATVGE